MNDKELKKEIKRIAHSCAWTYLTYQENIGMLSFIKKLGDTRARINVYVTKMTVGTSLTHPKKGKTQLFRRRCSLEMMKRIFKNPRQHTGRGYYLRSEGKR